MNIQHVPFRQSSGLRPPASLTEPSALGSGASLRQRLLPASTVSNGFSTTGNAGAVLEHLKRLSDRMTEETENTRQDVNAYREKLADVHLSLSRTEEELTRQRQENVLLRAKAKDDEMQVNYILEKMKVLTALQDDVRSNIHSTKCDIDRVDQFRRDLDVKMLGQDSDVSNVDMALHTMTATREQLQSELRRVNRVVVSLESQLRQTTEAADRQMVILEREKADAVARERTAEAHVSSLQTDLAASRSHAEQLRVDLDSERSRSSKAAAQLMERYQEAQQRIMELDRQLCELHHDKKAAREQIAELKEEAQVLTATAGSMRNEREILQAALSDRTSELKNASAEAEQLSHRLAAVQSELVGREVEIQRLVEERAEAAKRMEELGSALAIAQLNAANEGARADAAIAAAEHRFRELERAGEARLERFKERTSRENDEMRRRVRAEAEIEAKRLAEELKKATAALQSAQSLAAQKLSEREEGLRAELQALYSAEIATVKEEAQEASRRASIIAKESEARYERDLSAAHAAAKEALDTLQSRLETKHQEERDEWEREIELLTSAERAAAEERMQQSVQAVREELEAISQARMQEAALKADKRQGEVEDDMKRLMTRVQELERGSTAGDEALEAERKRNLELEKQLEVALEETIVAKLQGEDELKRLQEHMEQQCKTFAQQTIEWQSERRRLELDSIQSSKDWAAKEEELQHQVKKLSEEAREAQRASDLDREQQHQRQRELLQAKEQYELERKIWQDAAKEQHREIERQLHALGQELERARQREQELERTRQREQELESARQREQELERARQREQELERARQREQELERARQREQELESARQREQELERARQREQELERARQREQELERARQREQELERARQRELEREQNLQQLAVHRHSHGQEAQDLHAEADGRKTAADIVDNMNEGSEVFNAMRLGDAAVLELGSGNRAIQVFNIGAPDRIDCCEQDARDGQSDSRGMATSRCHKGQVVEEGHREDGRDGCFPQHHKLWSQREEPDASGKSGREVHLTKQDAEADAIAHNARVSGARRTRLATECAASDDEKLPSGAAAAMNSDGGGDARAKKPDGVSPRRKAAAARGKCRTPMSDVGNTEIAKEGNTKKSVASAGREPLAPQVTAFGISNVTSRPKDTNAMPPPPPAVKVAKGLELPSRLVSTQANGVLTDGETKRKMITERRPPAEFADLTTESEMDEPSLSQDVMVPAHVHKRTKTNSMAPSQMPAVTKGGRFSLFRGMSMTTSKQTNITDTDGGHEVNSGGGSLARKKGTSNPASKQRKAGEISADNGMVAMLFAGSSPFPKR